MNNLFGNYPMHSFEFKGRKFEYLREEAEEATLKEKEKNPDIDKKEETPKIISEKGIIDFLENSGKLNLALAKRPLEFVKNDLVDTIIDSKLVAEKIIDNNFSIITNESAIDISRITATKSEPQYPDDREPYTSMRQEAEALRERAENPEPYNEKYPPKVEKDPYNSNPNQERITYYDENGNVTRIDIIQYYENGSIWSKSTSLYNSDGKAYAGVGLSYYEDGTPMCIGISICDDLNADRFYMPGHQYTITFDEQGRPKREVFTKTIDSYTAPQMETYIDYFYDNELSSDKYRVKMQEILRSGQETISNIYTNWAENKSLASVGIGLQGNNYVWPNETADTNSNKFIDLYPDAFVEYMNRGDWGHFWWIGASYNGSTMSMNLTEENLDKLLSDDSAWTSDIRYQKDYIDALKAMAGIEPTDSKEQAKNKLIKLFSQFGGVVSENNSNSLNIENIDILSFYKAFGNTKLGSSLGIEKDFSEWQFQKLANEAFMENSGFCDSVMESEQFEEYLRDPYHQVNNYGFGLVALGDNIINDILKSINGTRFHTTEGYYNVALAKLAGLSANDTIEEARQKILDLLQNYALDSNGIVEIDNNKYENIDFVKFYKDLMKIDNDFKESMVRGFMSQNGIRNVANSLSLFNEDYNPEQTINILKEKTYFAKDPFHMAIAYAAGVTDEEIKNGDFTEIEKKIRKFYNEKLKGLNHYEILDYLFRNGLEGPIMDYYKTQVLIG